MILNKYFFVSLVFFVSFFQSLIGQGGTYYVTVNGKSSNDGRSEQTAWSLEHAVSRARAGDVVYIKAGTYHKSELRFGNNGTSSNPIVFIGYRNSRGDISTTPHGTMDHGDNIHSIGFPVINPSSKITLWLEGDHIELHNIGFTDPEGTSSYGALVDGEHNLLDNLAFSDYGPNGGTYKGWGVYVRGNHNQVINSYGENCGAEGFSVGPSIVGRGNDNVIKNNDYYSDDINKMGDYFFTVTYRGSNSNTASRNLFEGNRGYRLHDGPHLGHGLANAGGNNNTWRNNLMHRSRIEVRYETSYNIVYEGNRLTGFDDTVITISNGSHHLTFRNNYIEADYALIIFNALSGYNTNGLYSTSTGHDIDIYNNIFVGGRRSFTFGEEGIRSGSSYNINFSNNVFDRQSGGTRFYTPVSSLKVDNNIFTNSTSSKWVSHNGKSPGLSARNNIFHGNEHATPTSGFSGTINANPRFTNSGSGATKYKLQSDSPAINAGVSYSKRITDFAGSTILGSPDIGPHEYGGTQGSNSNNNNVSCSVTPEYSLNGTWQSGQTNLNVAEGTDVILSMLPNGVGLSVKLPNGQTVGDNYKLGKVSSSDSGAYILTSALGCQTTLNLTVGNSNNNTSNNNNTNTCPTGNIIPEYRLNGSWASGQNNLNVAEGTDVQLSMLPNGVGLSVKLPNGQTVGDNYKLGKVTSANSGSYVLTSAQGCQTTLNLTVGNSNNNTSNNNNTSTCPTGTIIPEYRLNGSWASGQNNLNVAEGTDVQLSMLPNGVGLSIKLPNGSTVGDNHKLGKVTASNSGTYILTTEDGCQTALNLTVGNSGSSSSSKNNCPAGSITPEYRIEGIWNSGQNSISTVAGNDVTFSMLPNGVGLTVRLPNGSTVGDNHKLTNVSVSDSGTYVLTSEGGCQTSVYLTVNPKGSSFKARINGISDDALHPESNLGASKISVYPNPVQRNMNIVLPQQSNYIQYALYTLSGAMIQQGRIDAGQSNFSVDVTEAPKGLLLLNVLDDTGQGEFLKILKE